MNGFEDYFCSRKSVLNKNDGMAIPPKRLADAGFPRILEI